MERSIRGGKANEVKQKDGEERTGRMGRRDGGRQRGCRTTGVRRGREGGGRGEERRGGVREDEQQLLNSVRASEM